MGGVHLRCGEMSVQRGLRNSHTFREPQAPGGAGCGVVHGWWTWGRPQAQAQEQGPKVDEEGAASNDGDRTRQ